MEDESRDWLPERETLCATIGLDSGDTEISVECKGGERFRVLAHNSPDVIMRFDRGFRHLYVNPVVFESTGISHLDYIGKTHKKLGFPAELIEIWEDAIQKVFDAHESHRIEFQLSNGTWIDWLLFPEFSPSGEVIAVLTTARDITPYKTIEETLRQEIIERQRSEEKQRLLESQLRETQKHEALGRLAGGIAHDFNNILSIMLGHVEVLLEDHPEESRTKVSLAHVWQAGERAAELIRQISLFTRVQENHLESTDLSQLIHETLSLIRAANPTSIEIRSHIQPNCSPIMADASQIQQVIVNLCVNARHAMREHGGTLDVSLVESTYGHELGQKLGLVAGSYLRLMISDTGQGMSAHVQEHIFEPFFTTKDVGEGSGLGLAVVHGIVAGHGGTISVESAVGKGTAFSIHFPVADELGAQPTPTRDLVDVKEGQGHILVVDDEVDLVRVYELALTRLGYQVTSCFNGTEALNVFRNDPNRYDLVFTDQVMPGLTGIQLSQELLNIRQDVPIILASGYSDSILEHDAEGYGLCELFLKPIKLRNLVSTIQKILARPETVSMLGH